jgi:hypothetical protein
MERSLSVRKEQSYLLRLWNDGKRGGFRASLEDIRSRKTTSFADLAKLAGYLKELEAKIGEKPTS